MKIFNVSTILSRIKRFLRRLALVSMFLFTLCVFFSSSLYQRSVHILYFKWHHHFTKYPPLNDGMKSNKSLTISHLNCKLMECRRNGKRERFYAVMITVLFFFPSKTSKTHSEWMNVENASVHELPQCVWMCRYPRLNWNILNCDTQSMRTNASKSHFEWCVLHLSSAMLHTYTHGGWWWLVRLFRPKQVFGVVWFILRFNPLCVTWRRSMCISWFQSTGSLTVRVCFASSWIDCIVWIP